MRGLAAQPRLPDSRGPLSHAVRRQLLDGATPLPDQAAVTRSDPYGEDVQLALHLCYELHYRGFTHVPDDREWDAGLLGFRSLLEDHFEGRLRRDCRRFHDVDEAFADILVEPVGGSGVSHHLVEQGQLWQMREYAALRSIYQLREADPHLWVVPRLQGRAKAAMVAVEYDEFGCGRAERMHSQLWADLMSDLGLDHAYGRYLESAGSETLATVNLMSLFGLHRRLRGALVGHFAAVEVTSSPGAARLATALRRLGAGSAAQRFYDEHVEADAVHEQLVRREVVGGLLDEEPGLAADVTFGIEATGFLEDRLHARVVGAWLAGRSALRTPLGTP
ncbi:iron-containing redox enzyme family protein [Streptomyces sp. NPDC001927]